MALRLRPILCAALAAACPAFAQDRLPTFAELEVAGAVIGEIKVDTHNIFDLEDAEENKLPYRVANALHFKTRPWFIRRYLLFKSGEPVSLRLIEETERLIRANSTVYEVEIVPVRYHDGAVDIEVRTRDTWTLQPGIRARREGGVNSGAFTLKETNLAGTGTSLGIERSTNVDRSGTELTLQHDHLLDGWTSVALKRASYDDGSTASFSINRPFYALDTRWAAGASASRFDRLDAFYQGGQNIAQYRHHGEAAEVYGGYSRGLINGWTHRYSAGISHQADAYGFDHERPPPPQLPLDRTLAGPFVRYEVTQDDFVQTANRDLIQRPEYLTMGLQAMLQVGRSVAAFGGTEQPWQLIANASKGFRVFAPGHQLLASFSHNAQYGAAENVRTTGAAARYFAPQTGKFVLYLASSLDHVQSPNQADELLLGGDNGLRGFPLRYQRGTNRVLFTAEERYYTELYPLRLFRVGAAVFYDIGRASGAQTPNAVNGWLSDIGIGLRILSARASFGSMLHIDLAFPLHNADPNVKSAQLLIKTGKTF